MLGALTSRTRVTTDALLREARFDAATGHERHSAGEPSPSWSNGSCDITVLLFTTKIKQCVPFSPPHNCSFKLEIAFCVRGVISPLAANIYLNEVDWAFDAIRRKTAEGPYEAVNYHRFADDIVITLSGHHTKRGWAARAQLRLQEQLTPLGVELNQEKTKVVDLLKGEAFGFLGFDLRRVRKGQGNGHYLQMTPKKKARKAIKAKVRDIIRHSGSTPLLKVVEQVNASLAGWVHYSQLATRVVPSAKCATTLR